MNEYKNKLIIIFILIISILLLFCSFYKVENAINCGFNRINDYQLIVSPKQLPTNMNLKFLIGNGEFYGKLTLLEYDGKSYIYQIKFKGSPNLSIIDTIIVINGKENIFEYIFNFLKNSF